MLGLPTETEEDMKEIAVLADKIARRYYEIPKDQRNGKCQITASSSFFIPKPFTPFQWAPMYENTEYIARAAIVKHAFQDQLNRKSLKYNWHDAEVTVLEGILARGDRKVGKLIEEVYRLGAIYDSWSDQSTMINGCRHLKILELILDFTIYENAMKMKCSRGISLILVLRKNS